MAINDPTQPQAPAGPDFSWLTQMANKAVQDALLTGQQAITGQAAALDQRLTAVEGQLADALAKAAPGVIADAGAAGVAVLTNIEDDPTTQRILVCSVVGALLLAGLIVLVTALLGNATANRWIAAAPMALGAAVLWVSKVGVGLPKRPSAQSGVTLPAIGPKAPGA